MLLYVFEEQFSDGDTFFVFVNSIYFSYLKNKKYISEVGFRSVMLCFVLCVKTVAYFEVNYVAIKCRNILREPRDVALG